MAIIKSAIKKPIKYLLQRILDYYPKDHKQKMMYAAMHAVQSWNLPPGDYLEFGVYKGRSFINAYNQARLCKQNMCFYAFDGFAGLPKVRGKDEQYSTFRQGDYACDEETFKKNLVENGVDLTHVTIIPGLFDKTLNDDTKKKLNINRAAIAWIDCDIYESTRPVLDFITDYLTTGSIIIFDDWFCFGGDPDAGEIRATREWLGERPHIKLVEYRKFGISGISFVVQIQERCQPNGLHQAQSKKMQHTFSAMPQAVTSY